MKKSYFKTKFQCTNKRCKFTHTFEAMEGLYQYIRYLQCPKCGKLGSLVVLKINKVKSYDVDFL